MTEEKITGLFGKYKIEKSDGTPVDPHAVYFVLRLDTDLVARSAARHYALNCFSPTLKNGLLKMLEDLELSDPDYQDYEREEES